MKLAIKLEVEGQSFDIEVAMVLPSKLEVGDWFLHSLSNPLIYELGNDMIGLPMNVGEPIELNSDKYVYHINSIEEL